MGKQLGPIEKIRFNCRKATFLIEKKQLAGLSMGENMELRIHLAGCSICRTFQRQSMLINTMVHELFTTANHTEVQLNDAYKKQLQQRINQEIDKK